MVAAVGQRPLVAAHALPAEPGRVRLARRRADRGLHPGHRAGGGGPAVRAVPGRRTRAGSLWRTAPPGPGLRAARGLWGVPGAVHDHRDHAAPRRARRALGGRHPRPAARGRGPVGPVAGLALQRGP